MKPHPHLFFDEDHWPVLAAKIHHPWYRRDWENLLKLTNGDLSRKLKKGHPYSLAMAYGAGSAARCAFIYRLTGKKRYLKRARAVIRQILASNRWTRDPAIKKNDFFQLYTAGICRNLALTYDYLAEEMTQKERKQFGAICCRKAVLPFLEDCHSGKNRYLYGKVTNNWPAVLASGAGLLMLALNGDGIDLSREIEIARAHALRFVEWHDESGSAIEHGSYWAYPMANLMLFLLALQRNGWPGIFEQPSMKILRTAYPEMCMTIGDRMAANFGNTDYRPFKARDQALMLAHVYRDGRLLWWANHLVPGYTPSLIFGPTDLEPIPPDDVSCTQVFEGSGIGIMRSSMTDPNTLFLGIKGGAVLNRVSNCPHTHFDLNSVVVEGFGKRLIADPGYGHVWFGPYKVTDPAHHSNSAPVHNTLLFDGKGQRDYYNPSAQLQDLSPNPDVDYIVSRLEQGYGPRVKRFDRHAYMISKRCFVIWDDVELDRPRTLTWNFHCDPDARLETNGRALILNGEVCLEMVPLGKMDLTVHQRRNHRLPYLQFKTKAKVTRAACGWGMRITSSGRNESAPQFSLVKGLPSVRIGRKSHRLPVVRRRTTAKSSFNLIPDLEKIHIAVRMHRE